jgi:cold shock protein
MQGVIKRLMDKGFGFISVEGEENDLFFHMNDLVGVQFNDLQEGQAVTFEKGDSHKGPKAVEIQLAEGGAAPTAETESCGCGSGKPEAECCALLGAPGEETATEEAAE